MRKHSKFFFMVCSLFLSQNAAARMRVEAPASVKQGGVIKVVIKGEDYAYKLKFGDVSVEILPDKLALISVAVDEVPGYRNVCVEGHEYGICSPIEIEKVDFPIAGDIGFVSELTGKLKIRFDAEKDELKKLFALNTLKRYWKEDLKFSPPLKDMAWTSPFGQIRHKISTKKGKLDIYHYGVDLHADVRTHVFAAESGIVRIAKNMLAEGNMVAIDHGYGLVSLYFHLSKLKVKEGSFMPAGQEIALSGQSGAATGPHLHFEVRLRGVAVSPWNFMPEPLIYKPPAQVAKQQRGAK